MSERGKEYLKWFGAFGSAWTQDQENKIMAKAEEIVREKSLDESSEKQRAWALNEAIDRLGAKDWLLKKRSQKARKG